MKSIELPRGAHDGSRFNACVGRKSGAGPAGRAIQWTPMVVETAPAFWLSRIIYLLGKTVLASSSALSFGASTSGIATPVFCFARS
jgi:hypothetical protein